VKYKLSPLPQLAVLKKEHDQPGAVFALEHANGWSITKFVDRAYK
jgi:hypothetical protein